MKTNSDREYLILFINYLQIKFHKRLTIKKKKKRKERKRDGQGKNYGKKNSSNNQFTFTQKIW